MDTYRKGETIMLNVNVTKEEVVVAALPMQEHWLPSSNLDLILPQVDVGVFFCYKNDPKMSFESMVCILKSSLGQALVSYYAFGGELVKNSMGEPELLCNNRGVDFVEANADAELQNLNFYNPDHSVEGKLVPKKKHGVLAVQATRMKCGGIVVGCSFDHRVADAYSTNMFLVSWAEIARPNRPNNNNATQPCYRRSLLIPRRPLCIDPSLEDMYVAIHGPQAEEVESSETLISRIYYITAEELNKMQSEASSKKDDNKKRTKLESFSAFLWQMVASATASSPAITNNANKTVVAKMGVVVDGRTRLSNGDKDKEALMSSYFGNVLSIPFGTKPVEELVEKPLCWVADEVHRFLDTAVTEEHFLGLIDWVEAHRPVPGLARIYRGSTNEVGPSLVVSSGQRFPESKVDFGWGKPLFGSYHFPWGGDAGYVMPMPSPKQNGDWVVYMHLLKGHLDFIQSCASHIFRPLSWDYLNNNDQH